MITNNYKIANKVVEVNSIYNEVHDYCKDYISTEKADYSVTTTQEDIKFEREKSKREDIAKGVEIQNFSDSYLEELAVYRKIADKMVDYNTILFHGSVIAVDHEGYIFTAKSGTGKSTHARLWKKYFGERAIMVNDDKPLISIGEKIIAYGTPYNGKHRLGNNISIELKSLCILHQSKKNEIVQIGKAEAFKTLVQQVYRPIDIIKLKKVMTLMDEFADKIKLYKLGCNMDISAAETAYKGMR